MSSVRAVTPVRIGAALFNGDHTRLADEVRRLEDAGVDFVHFDIFDGHFVSGLGFPVRTLEALRPLTRLPFEVHLGVANPNAYAAPLKEAGADRVLVHVESTPMLFETLFLYRDQGLEVGAALGLATPIEALAAALPFIDAALLLARVTGEGTLGATYRPEVEPRLKKARQLIDGAGRAVELQVAGGVNRTNAPAAVAAGARALALGAGLYKVKDMAREVEALRAATRGIDA